MKFLHPAMWHDHDIDFARWLHPATWHVALRSWQWIHQVAVPCNVIQTYAILEFYFWFRFWPYHHNRHVILHQSAKFYPIWTTLGRKNDFMLIFKMADLCYLWFRGPIMCSLKSPCTTSYGSPIDTTALNCLVWENGVFAFWCQDPRWRISAILDFKGPSIRPQTGQCQWLSY